MYKYTEKEDLLDLTIKKNRRKKQQPKYSILKKGCNCDDCLSVKFSNQYSTKWIQK